MMSDFPESNWTHKEACPKCPSSDGLGVYDDGHTHCFVCGYHTKPDGSHTPSKPRSKMSSKLWSDDEYNAVYGELKRRGITEDTCRKFGYKMGNRKGKSVQVANYFKDNQVVCQKVRYRNKDFIFNGGGKDAPLYGQWLWRDGGKMVVITEGEIDCMTVSQLQGNKWPVVSVPNGAQGAKKSLQRHLEWLEGFDSVVLMFDMDDPGQEAAKECASVLTPGKCKIARLPMKDPNEMLLAGRGSEVIDAVWGAKEYRPDGLVSLLDIMDEIMKPVEYGLPWFLPELTNLTYGRRPGETYFFGAGTGVGKTDLFTQSMAYDAIELNQKIGVFYLEQGKAETGQRIAGKSVGKLFHIPGENWTPEDLSDALSNQKLIDNVMLYDSWGCTEWEVLRSKIIYLAAQGYRLFYIDHLTALATGQQGDERTILEEITADMAKLAKRLDINLHVISHLATPEGKSHEEGGRVLPKHFKGSRAIAFWAHFMFGLERDTLSDDPAIQRKTTFRVLKDRYTGRSTGKYFNLSYEQDTGLLIPMHPDEELLDDDGF